MEEIPVETKDDGKFKKEIELKSNKNNLYKILLNTQENNLIIKALGLNSLIAEKFSNKFPAEKIRENKYLAMCDNLNEICNELESHINSKDMLLTENEDTIIVSITLPSVKVKEIKFGLIKNTKNENEKINELTNIILELKNKINELENTVSNQQKEINILKQKTKFLPKTIELEQSKILEGKEDYSFINSLFSNECSFGLLYRATRDGSYPADYHRKCDNQGPTLTLIKTDNNRRFGGFISKDRLFGTNNEVNVKDKNAFIFSVDKKKKYNIKDGSTDAFSYSSIRGPNFTGNLGFFCNEDSGNMFKPKNCYESKTNLNYNSNNDYEFAGKNNFKAVEIEIFKVIEEI